mgnify:CR=1 FL=1
MPRLARAVAAGYPHHITQRGNRRQQTFFCDEDYEEYLTLMAEWCGRWQVEIWAYCLMPNHVHLVAVPQTQEGLRLAIAEAHRRYSRRINFRQNWRGHLWQGRFASCIMDWPHLITATRYIEMNPVRSGLVGKPENWRWSSAREHIDGADDTLANAAALREKITTEWRSFLSAPVSEEDANEIRAHERTGRPLGTSRFVEHLEHLLDRALKPGKPGPKPRELE